MSRAIDGHDMGAASWVMHSSLLENFEPNVVDPPAWMTDVLEKLVTRWPTSKIEKLMPWAWGAAAMAGHAQNAA